jgi:glycosyltransferase involved in cell wall biosynthesis
MRTCGSPLGVGVSRCDLVIRKAMQLDVILPTFNRQELLKRALDSLRCADVPVELEVRITVIDNNSEDDTRRLVESVIPDFDGRLTYLFESQPGKSFALNKGISSTTGELLGFIDDDEEIDVSWYKHVHLAFTNAAIDFVGGPYIPRWGADRPDWLPTDYLGVIGWVDGGPDVRPYGKEFPGILMGGNAVIRRSVLERAGPYATHLGPKGNLLLRGEDDEMYHRLLAAGAQGFYLPDLAIYHYVPAERLTKKYFRKWCFWRGAGMGVFDRDRRQAVPYLLGIPRWLYGRAARGIVSQLTALMGGGSNPAQGFSHELALWDLAGFFYGKHFCRPEGGREAAHRPGSSSSETDDVPQSQRQVREID